MNKNSVRKNLEILIFGSLALIPGCAKPSIPNEMDRCMSNKKILRSAVYAIELFKTNPYLAAYGLKLSDMDKTDIRCLDVLLRTHETQRYGIVEENGDYFAREVVY